MKIKAIDDTGVVAIKSDNNKLMMNFHVYQSRLIHASDEVIMKTGQKLGWRMDPKGNKSPRISCAMGKTK